MGKNVFELFSHHFLKGFSLTPSDALDTGHSWFTESHSEVEYLLKVEVKNQNSSGVILNVLSRILRIMKGLGGGWVEEIGNSSSVLKFIAGYLLFSLCYRFEVVCFFQDAVKMVHLCFTLA